MKISKIITVTEFVGYTRAATDDNPETLVYKYQVEKLKNLTAPHLGAKLTEDEVNDLINAGIDVTIIPRKG